MFEINHQLEIQQCKCVLSVFLQALLWTSSSPLLMNIYIYPPLVFGVDSSYCSIFLVAFLIDPLIQKGVNVTSVKEISETTKQIEMHNEIN